MKKHCRTALVAMGIVTSSFSIGRGDELPKPEIAQATESNPPTSSVQSPPEISADSPAKEAVTSETSDGSNTTQRQSTDASPDRMRDRLGDRLQLPTERLRENAGRIADRARQLQENWNGRQPVVSPSQPRFRIGIDCRPTRILVNEIEPDTNAADESKSKPSAFEVQSVLADSPAQQTGIEPGDQIELINGKPMLSIEQLVELVQESGRSGQKLVLEVLRKQERLEFEIVPVVMDDLNSEEMRLSFPFQNGAPGNFQGGFGGNIPNAFPGGFPGMPGQFGPGWVMNREELNELRRDRQEAAERANAAAREHFERQQQSIQPNVPSARELQSQLEALQKDVTELKSMLKILIEKP